MLNSIRNLGAGVKQYGQDSMEIDQLRKQLEARRLMEEEKNNLSPEITKNLAQMQYWKTPPTRSQLASTIAPASDFASRHSNPEILKNISPMVSLLERNIEAQEAFDRAGVGAQIARDKLDWQKTKPEKPVPNVVQQSLDKEFAKEYNEWAMKGGRTGAYIEIKKLGDVAERLKTGEVKTGGTRGMLHDRLEDPKLIAARADITSTIMESLRKILGAAFTEKEGQRVIAATWNEADTTENNHKRVQRLTEFLTQKAKALDAASEHFASNNLSLEGFKGELARDVKDYLKEFEKSEDKKTTSREIKPETKSKISELAKNEEAFRKEFTQDDINKWIGDNSELLTNLKTMFVNKYQREPTEDEIKEVVRGRMAFSKYGSK